MNLNKKKLINKRTLSLVGCTLISFGLALGATVVVNNSISQSKIDLSKNDLIPFSSTSRNVIFSPEGDKLSNIVYDLKTKKQTKIISERHEIMNNIPSNVKESRILVNIIHISVNKNIFVLYNINKDENGNTGFNAWIVFVDDRIQPIHYTDFVLGIDISKDDSLSFKTHFALETEINSTKSESNSLYKLLDKNIYEFKKWLKNPDLKKLISYHRWQYINLINQKKYKLTIHTDEIFDQVPDILEVNDLTNSKSVSLFAFKYKDFKRGLNESM